MSRTSHSDHPSSRSVRGGGVYIHIPFCDSICSYCHFERITGHDADLRRRYVEAVLAELSLRDESCGLGRFSTETLYIGGGTPSVLEATIFRGLLDRLEDRLNYATDIEITVEANPESLNGEGIAVWRRAGVNRVSLGVQSLQGNVLKILGRQATAGLTRDALRLATDSFPRVSADWILAPGVDPEALIEEFAWAKDLGVGHISFYILEVHSGTHLAGCLGNGQLEMPTQEWIGEIYLQAVAALANLGYRQYEVSNFAQPGEISRHNAAYWQHVPYLGLGVAAHGYWGCCRYANHAEIGTYLESVDRGVLPVASMQRLDPVALRLEKLILPLRTVAGVPLDRVPLETSELEAGRKHGLWKTLNDRLKLTPRGFLRIDALEEMMVSRLGRDVRSP